VPFDKNKISTGIDIIIVAYNSKKVLERTLPGLVKEANALNAKLTIVDNHSTDKTATWIKNIFPSIRLVELNTNTGFAKANNIGLRGSTSQYIMFLNPDVLVPYGSIQKLFLWMQNQSDVGVAGPRLVNEDGTLQFSCRYFPTLLTYFFEIFSFDRRFPTSAILGKYLMTFDDHLHEKDVDYVCGAAMMVRNDLLKLTGPFDEDFFIYAEEAELCWRVHQCNYRVVYWPEVEMTHIGGESTKQFKKEMYSENIRSRWLFFNKTKGFIYGLFYLLIAVGYSIISGKQLCSNLWRK
jgi:GT2 family glycosyltransferase